MIEQEDTNLKMVIADRDKWKKTAEALALEIGKPRYAQIEYENQLLAYIESLQAYVKGSIMRLPPGTPSANQFINRIDSKGKNNE